MNEPKREVVHLPISATILINGKPAQDLIGARVTHPNFRIGPGQKNIKARWRSILVSIPQEVFDMVMNEVDAGRAQDSRDVIARALEKHLNLPEGSATKE